MQCTGIRPLITALLLLSPPLWARADSLVRLASDDWCPFICAAEGKINSGFLVDVSARAMALSGYRVEPVLRPLTRAIRETLDGNIEGVYAPPLDQRLGLSAPIAYSRACFYTRAGESWTYQGLASLSQRSIGVIADYAYDDGMMDAYIARHYRQPALIELAHGDTAGINNLQKLRKGRYHAMLEHEAVLAHLSQQLKVASQIRQAGCLEQALPLSIGFARQDGRTEAWLHALNEGMHQLEASGELKALRQHYGLKPVAP